MKEQGEKGRKADESWHSGKKLRIRLIHEFIMGASGTQSEMLIYVNKKIKGVGSTFYLSCHPTSRS